MDYQLSANIIDTIVLNLRNKFKTDTDFPYVELSNGDLDYNNTKIEITSETPHTLIKMPTIVVNCPNVTEEHKFFNDFLLEASFDEELAIAEVQGMGFLSDVNISLQVERTYERDQIIEKIYQYLRFPDPVLLINGISVYGLNTTSSSHTRFGTRDFYTNDIHVRIYHERIETSQIDELQRVTKIKVTSDIDK